MCESEKEREEVGRGFITHIAISCSSYIIGWYNAGHCILYCRCITGRCNVLGV